jgi:hypothetical protein
MKRAFLALTSGSIGLILALGVAEILIRSMGISSEIPYRPDSAYGWGHVAGARFTRRTGTLDVDIRINELGHRGGPTVREKPEDEYRILLLGDSFAEAFQVPEEDTFGDRLAELLEAAAGRTVRVLNSGTSGYGTDNALLYFRGEGVSLDPDLVVLAFYIGNDVRNNWYELENVDAGGFRKPYFVVEDRKLVERPNPNDVSGSWGARAKIFLNAHSRLFSLARQVRDRIGGRDIQQSLGMPLDMNLFSAEYSSPWLSAWEVTEKLLDRLNREALRSRTNLFVLIIPTQFQVERSEWHAMQRDFPEMLDIRWDLDKPNTLLRDILARLGIPHFDLLPAFQANHSATGRPLYLAGDGHWNTKGHSLAAELIARELLSGDYSLRATAPADSVEPRGR